MQQQRQDNRVNPEFASIEKDTNILRDAGYSLYQNPDTENTQALDYPEVNFSGPSFIPSIPMPTNEKVEKAKVNGLVAKVRAKKPKSITEEVATSLSAGASINSSIGGNTEYINKRDVPLMEQYDELNDGTLIPKYERFTHGINNEEKLAKQMTTGQKWGRGFKKLAVKSALYTAGGVTQSVASIAHAIQKGSIDALFDNETTRWFQDQETRLDHNLAHYYTFGKGFLQGISRPSSNLSPAFKRRHDHLPAFPFNAKTEHSIGYIFQSVRQSVSDAHVFAEHNHIG